MAILRDADRTSVERLEAVGRHGLLLADSNCAWIPLNLDAGNAYHSATPCESNPSGAV